MSYAPDESPAALYAEGSWLQGALVTSYLYGIVFILYIMCISSLFSRLYQGGSYSHGRQYHKTIFFIVYVTLIFVIGTVYVAFNNYITQEGFINQRNYPGGPSAFEENTSSVPLNAAFTLSDWLADVLMIWRCIVVYRDSRFYWAVAGFISLLFIACVGLGIAWLASISQNTQWMVGSFLLAYLVLSLAVTIILSLLITLRILYHRQRITHALGKGHTSLYTSIVGMVIESAAVYSVCSVAYLVSFLADHPSEYALLQILGEAQCIAPLLIIYRVTQGKVYTAHSASGTVHSPSISHLERRSGVTRASTRGSRHLSVPYPPSLSRAASQHFVGHSKASEGRLAGIPDDDGDLGLPHELAPYQAYSRTNSHSHSYGDVEGGVGMPLRNLQIAV
ncbi:hypothetical protein CONPUDRAFT_106259, partial [Coniophora puteana RWD-64-598 SS2]